MKDPIAKLYEKMTPDELASLALKAVCAGDPEEGRRIAGFVPRVPYVGNDLDYMRRVEGFFGMAEHFAKSFWHIRFRREEAFTQALSFAMNPGIDTEGKVFSIVCENLVKYEAWLMALDGALDAVCLEANLDPDAVRALESIKRFQPMARMEGGLEAKPDPETLDWMAHQLTSHLEGRRGMK